METQGEYTEVSLSGKSPRYYFQVFPNSVIVISRTGAEMINQPNFDDAFNLTVCSVFIVVSLEL